VVTVGFIDATCPPSSVYAAYNALGGKHEIFNSINTGHTNTPAQTDFMRKAITAYVASMKK
jgi:cephalosporin-C deacetylase-like acetyl esterase